MVTKAVTAYPTTDFTSSCRDFCGPTLLDAFCAGSYVAGVLLCHSHEAQLARAREGPN